MQDYSGASGAEGTDVAASLRAADPERALAIAYAPAPIRPALAALFMLDLRFGAILSATREPMIGAMRLAWWREALETLDRAAPPAEPLLGVLAAHVVPRGVAGAELAAMEDGWAALLEGDPPAAAQIARHGEERGARLFGLAGRLLGDSDEKLTGAAGAGWALADLAQRLSNAGAAAEARRQALARLEAIRGRRWPAALRPIGMLAVLARRDAERPEARRPGSPRRLARMLAHRLTGR